MKVLRFANGEEQKIIRENGRFFFTETARFRKANYDGCVVEIKEKKEPLPFELPEEQEEAKAAKKPAKKSSKKSVEKE